MFFERNGLSTIDELLLSHEDVCIHQFERILFGHSSRHIYDPLPVTKRFMSRVNGGENSMLPVLMLLSNRVPANDTKDGKSETVNCIAHKYHSHESNSGVYHFLRSMKECAAYSRYNGIL
mmetsp:Transcript_23475/g.47870  ORF Transcript_23475/g.47870 Transcript_23475/m.47870 type:complete len:120 (-) Transcript_23475:47-406(-)